MFGSPLCQGGFEWENGNGLVGEILEELAWGKVQRGDVMKANVGVERWEKGQASYGDVAFWL